MTTKQPPRVVCLGGGYSTLWFVFRLRRAIRRGDLDVTVISRDNFHVFHGFVGEMLAGRIQPEQVISSARRIFSPARFFNAEIEDIDLDRQQVVTSRMLDGRQYEVPYDHLLFNLGSSSDLSNYPGIREHALQLKSYWDCFKTRSQLMSVLEMAEIEPDPEERRRLLTVVVVGGNFGGIEVAAELLDYFRLLARTDYPSIDPEEVRIVVVHGGARILPEMQQTDPKLVDYAERFLDEVGLEIHLNTRVAAATPEEAVLDTGERIPTRTIISCAGTAMSPLVRGLPVEKHESGRLAVRPTGQLVGHDNLWAAGDCAALPHPDGGVCPQTAIYAMMGGRHAANNLLRQRKGKELKSFWFTGLGEAASLGHRRAIYYLRGLRVTGLLAWVLWRLTFLLFMPSWSLRLRVVADWFVTALTGRNIINIQVREPYGVRRQRYESGQAIVRQGEVGRHLFVIVEGEAEVVREEDDGGETHLADLGPGEHFGEMAIFKGVRRTATVRAVTPVEVLSLGDSASRALSEAVAPFGAKVRRTPGSTSSDADDTPRTG